MYNILLTFIFYITIVTILMFPKYKNKIKIIEIKNKNCLDQMESIEKKHKKFYPIGKDKFSIIHYPKYSSFFNQFHNYKYFVAKIHNNILSTCCVAQLNNLWYICDLKSFSSGHNSTYEFGKYILFNLVCNFKNLFTFKFKPNFFGIVMEPNNIINHIGNKYYFTKYETLYLYQINCKIYNKNKNLFDNIFPNHFMVEGYKKLLLNSTNQFIKMYHIAQPIDSNYVKIQNAITINDNLEFDIMFCLPKNHHFVDDLKLVNINFISEMSIMGYNCNHIKDWCFIKTYMI